MAGSFKNLRRTSESHVFQQVLRRSPSLQRTAARERDPMALQVERAQAQGADNVFLIDAVLRGYNPERTLAEPVESFSPEVISISPNEGFLGGGLLVTIEVNSALYMTGAALGDAPLTDFEIVDATHVRGRTGEHAAGVVDVTVTNIFGTGVLADGFTYVPSDPTWLLTESGEPLLTESGEPLQIED